MSTNIFSAINAAQIHYSFHTATLTARLSEIEFKFIKEQLCTAKENIIMKYYPEHISYSKIYNFFTSPTYGAFLIKMIRCSKNEFVYREIVIRINPRAMLHKNDYPYVYIASQKDIRKCIKIMEKFFHDTKINHWISLEILRISRIDLAANINLGDNESVRQYMKLLRQGNYPYSMKRVCIYSKSQKREIPTPNSFTIKSKTYEFSIYDKQRQLTDNKKDYSDKEITEAEGIIRIEFRISSSSLIHNIAKKKFKYEKTADILLNADVMAEFYIIRYIEKCYGTGAFVKKAEAEKIINSSNYKAKIKQEMNAMLNCCMQTRNLSKVRLIFKERFEPLLKRFNNLGISPVTINSRNNYNRFENPLYYITECNANTNKYTPSITEVLCMQKW